MNKKIVLMTGIGGSIGCHFFAHIMHHTDWDIVGIDSFRHKGWTDRVSHMFTEHPDWRERLKLITHDISAPLSEILIAKIGKIDYVINLASLSDVYDSIVNPVPFIKNNIDLVLNMLEYARVAKPQVFIQISTDETTGPTNDGERHVEWDPILPSNPYSASKASQESIAISYWRTYNIPLIITNTVNNFGEMQQASKFPVIVQKKVQKDETVTIHGKEGEIGTRYYIHSRNFADAILFILNNTTPYLHTPNTVDRPDKYNITSDDNINNLELAQLIAKLMGKPLKYELQDSQFSRPGHDRAYGLSGEKLKNLGWVPPLSFEESLSNVIKWQEENHEWIQ